MDVGLDLTIRPGVGVGLLTFGMTRAEVAAAFAPPSRQIEQYGGTIVDYYPDLLLSLSYDEQGRLEFIEWRASQPSTLLGVRIDGGITQEAISRLAPVAGAPDASDAGIDFRQACVSLYAPGGHVEGVSAYVAGYYDKP